MTGLQIEIFQHIWLMRERPLESEVEGLVLIWEL